MRIRPLRHSFTVEDAKGTLLRHGPNLWRYAHATTPDDPNRILCPSRPALTKLEVTA